MCCALRCAHPAPVEHRATRGLVRETGPMGGGASPRASTGKCGDLRDPMEGVRRRYRVLFYNLNKQTIRKKASVFSLYCSIVKVYE